jgi:hypothetical protein
MPLPMPQLAWLPRKVTVRIGTLKVAAPPGRSTPMAPQYTPRGPALQRPDRPHGAHLGRARDRAAGEQRRKHIRQAAAGPRARLHVRGHLPHGGQRLGVEQARHAHAEGLGDAREVVAQQVHDHHVLGALLGRAAQGLGLRGVVFGIHAARRRAFHGPRQQQAFAPVEKQLGRDRQQLLLAGVQKSRITAGLGALQGLEQARPGRRPHRRSARRASAP